MLIVCSQFTWNKKPYLSLKNKRMAENASLVSLVIGALKFLYRD